MDMLLVSRNTFDMLSFISLMSSDMIDSLAASAVRLRLVRGVRNSSSESYNTAMLYQLFPIKVHLERSKVTVTYPPNGILSHVTGI